MESRPEPSRGLWHTHADRTCEGCVGLEAGAAAPHPAHLRVPRQDCNTSLVRACWNELFTLGLAQCAQVMSLSTILAAIVNHLQNSIQEGRASLSPRRPGRRGVPVATGFSVRIPTRLLLLLS